MGDAMIESLTPEQEALLIEYRDEGIRQGLSTEPMLEKEAGEFLCQAYEAAGLKPPTDLIYELSPWAGIQEVNKIEGNDKMVWYNPIYGCHDQDWLSYYKYYLEVLKLECCEPLRPLINLATTCGWVWVGTTKAVITDRPAELHRDDDLRLHRDGGPAARYRDDYSVYCWHGTRLPDRMGECESRSWEPKWLLDEENAEIRRILLEGMGYDRVMSKLNSRLIHKQGNMELREITDNVDVEPIRLLKVVCPSTESVYSLRVPLTYDTCEAARRWTLWDDNSEYDILKET